MPRHVFWKDDRKLQVRGRERRKEYRQRGYKRWSWQTGIQKESCHKQYVYGVILTQWQIKLPFIEATKFLWGWYVKPTGIISCVILLKMFQGCDEVIFDWRDGLVGVIFLRMAWLSCAPLKSLKLQSIADPCDVATEQPNQRRHTGLRVWAGAGVVPEHTHRL